MRSSVRRHHYPIEAIVLGVVALLKALALSGAEQETIQYDQLKGEALAAVLKPLPPKEPDEALKCLEVIKGFSVEYVAHEPLVLDPVAAAIDENGVMYVAEDADYPYRPEAGEAPKGRIRVLKDNDGDGYYEESHLFAEGLLWPAGVAPWKGGVFVTAPPDIWYLKDTDGDFKADVKEKLFSGFGTGGSQYIMNNLQWGLDHKIYAAVAGNGGAIKRADRPELASVSVSRRDFRFDPVTRDYESISGGKQFGNTFDDWGNRFLCTQDTPVYQVVFPRRYLDRNPFLALPESSQRLTPGATPIFRTSAIEAWRAIRSSRRLLTQKGSPNDSGVSHHVLDGVAGVTIYRSGAFPREFYGNVFVGDAQNNLVHRRSLTRDGVLFRSDRLDSATEFLRSTDNWFRPVNFLNAPDGTLYVLDLAREVLEAVHIPMDVVAHLDLTRGRDRGRIFRVKPDGFQRPPPPKLSGYTSEQLVASLESPHAWWRETAHRLLYERLDPTAVPPLRRLLRDSLRPQARLHALWSLEGLKALSDADLLAGLADSFPGVRENAIRLAEPRLGQQRIASRCVELTSDPDASVRFQLALTLGEFHDPRSAPSLASLAKRDAGDLFIRTAILSSSPECAPELLRDLVADRGFAASHSGVDLLQELGRVLGGRNRAEEIRGALSAVFRQGEKQVQRALIIGVADGLQLAGAPPGALASCLEPAVERLFGQLADEAIQTVRTQSNDAEQVKRSLRFLENTPDERAVTAITQLLDQHPPAEIQIAAVRGLSRMNPAGFEDVLLARWKSVSPLARREILSALLTRTERVGALLSAIEAGQIKLEEVDAASRARLRNHSDESIRKRADALWSEARAGSTTDAIQHYRRALILKGVEKSGEEIFQRLCSTCHRLNGLGTDIGPNLALSATRSPDELLTHILDPNRAVDPAYVQYTIATVDGESYSGLIVADNGGSVVLKGVNLQKTISRAQIKSMTSDGVSLMPVGLEQGLSLQQMADLLSFLIGAQYDYGTSGQSFSRDVPERK